MIGPRGSEAVYLEELNENEMATLPSDGDDPYYYKGNKGKPTILWGCGACRCKVPYPPGPRLLPVTD